VTTNAVRQAGEMLNELRQAGELCAGRPTMLTTDQRLLASFGISQQQSSVAVTADMTNLHDSVAC
jgi:hypothetical protein